MTQTVDPGTRVADLAAAADRIRHHILDMGEVQGQGYVGQGLGFADASPSWSSPATAQPSRANRWAVARPMPRSAPTPVMTTVRCVLLMGFLL